VAALLVADMNGTGPIQVFLDDPLVTEVMVSGKGDDAHGTKLEVLGVELADGRLRVIHAMPMRPGYEPLYQEAHQWRQ
jgi:Flp pilus assembly CpaF family ATPase